MEKHDYDVLITGGGVIGCATAYHLLRAEPAIRVAVVEKDPSYQFASTALSWGGVRAQFSLKENILIALYAQKVFESFPEQMEVEGDRPDIGYRREGYLFLIEPAAEDVARASLNRQKDLGAEVEWWSPEEIKRNYPLLEVSTYSGGTFGPRDGCVDPFAVLMAYKKKSRALGASFIQDTVLAFDAQYGKVEGARLASGRVLGTGVVVNAAGAWAAELAATAGINLPVEPVKRQCFAVKPEATIDKPLPLIIAPSGLFFRSETGGLVIIGKSFDDDPVGFDFSYDRSRFEETLWPELVKIVPRFDRLKFVRGWAGLYDVNRLDSNTILGEWPSLKGFFLACGFSGHGLMQAPAVGRYLAEIILGRTPSLDLSVFGPERILKGEAIRETGLI